MIGTGKPKINFDGLKELFWSDHKVFLKNHRKLIEGKLSERCLCGALMYELNKQLEMKGYNNYYADVEFNKVGKKEKRRNLLCSWSGRKGRGSKKMKILLSYINKKDSHTSTVMGVFLS